MQGVGMRHFLDLSALDGAQLRRILDTAAQLKRERASLQFSDALKHRKLAMIFEKNSTRTRVSFEVAMLELGGHAMKFAEAELQLGRGETVADTAKVLSRYVDFIMLRTHSHERLKELAQHATVPVINGLSDISHPCQILADILTFEERNGPVAGKVFAWVGDGNNVATSFIEASALLGFTLRLACPHELMPSQAALNFARNKLGNVLVTTDPFEAVEGAQAVVTDTWVSMGDKDAERRVKLLTPYQVNSVLMARAAKNALFFHCLPAHRGEEVTAEVIDGPQSVIFDEAENRLHVQKAILLWCAGLI